MERNSPFVFIIEDSEEMLWSVANVLESAGFCVDAVTTGKEALEKLKNSPETELVIVNYLLPDMTGLKVMEQLRGNGCQAEVIAISAFGTKEIHDSFLTAGAFAFLEKPFDIRELVDICKQALMRSNSTRKVVPKN